MSAKIKAAEKVFNDHKVNGGFPKGMTYKDLAPGACVLVRWTDAEDTPAIIVGHDERRHNYKGDRIVQVLCYERKGKSIQAFSHKIAHTQIVGYLPALAGEIEDTMRDALDL